MSIAVPTVTAPGYPNWSAEPQTFELGPIAPDESVERTVMVTVGCGQHRAPIAHQRDADGRRVERHAYGDRERAAADALPGAVRRRHARRVEPRRRRRRRPVGQRPRLAHRGHPADAGRGSHGRRPGARRRRVRHEREPLRARLPRAVDVRRGVPDRSGPVELSPPLRPPVVVERFRRHHDRHHPVEQHPDHHGRHRDDHERGRSRPGGGSNSQ